MNNKNRFFQSSAIKLLRGALTATLALALLAFSVASNAQDTSSSIRGKVLDSSGATVEGAAVVVEDLRSGVERTYSTNSSGLFLATRLLPGGPYRVTVNGTSTADVASVSVGDIYNLTVNMQDESAIEEIIAVGVQSDLVQVAAGPSATFDLQDLENSVSFGRDISDVYGIDPRMMIDVDEDGVGINCGGNTPASTTPLWTV